MAKKKYKSEKKITVGGKDMWLTKIEDKITVQDGEDIAFSGSANGFQAWLKIQNNTNKKKK